jgi:RecA-family ATPase
LREFFGRSEGAVFFCSLGNEPGRHPPKELITRELDKVEAFVRKWDVPGRALYFCVNTIKGKRRNKANVAELVGLHADLDFKGIVEDHIEDVLAGLPHPPSCVVASGHGLHCYWLFDEVLPATDEDKARVETLLKKLADVLAGDPAVCEVARLMRLPGSHNTKNGEWLPVEIVCSGGDTYTIETLEAWLNSAEPELTRKSAERKASADNPFSAYGAEHGEHEPLDADELLEDLQYPGNVHDTENRLLASKLSKGEPVDEAITFVLQALSNQIPEATTIWDMKEETRILRQSAISWFVKKPDVLELQPEPLPEWLANDKKIKELLAKVNEQTVNEQTNKVTEGKAAALTIPGFSDDWCDVTKIPRRRWLYGQHYIRGSATITIAESGIGKSTLEICEAIAIASGEALLGVTVDEPVKVWYWNGEEPWNEIARRVHAVCEHYKIPPRSIADKFHFTSGLDQFPIKIVTDTPGGPKVNEKLVAQIIDYIRANDIGVVFIDPLISCHSVAENDTSGMDAVAKTWAKVATATNCAIELVHHTRKPGRESDGENYIADARGAGALVAAVRGSRIINQMTEGEAGEFDIEGERFDYFRVNRGKVNMTRRSGSTSWFRLVSVTIGNGEPNNPTEGDNVQTLTSWKPPDVFDIITNAHMHAVRAKAATGEYMRDHRAKEGNWIGEVIAEVVGLDVEAQRMLIEKIIKTWLELRLLKTVSRSKGKETNYRERKFIEPGDWVPE